MPKIKYGIGLPISAGDSPWFGDLNFEQMKNVTLMCEELDFESIWAPDHLMTGLGFNTLEAWTFLSAMSQVTKKMRLGTLVDCPTHRNPAMLAKTVATLDYISNGRVDLGIGAGWNGYEQLAYGLPWEELPKIRIERLVETLQILKGLWTHDTFSFTGKHYQVREGACFPKPLQKPSPKIMIGGRGEKRMLKVVAQYADAWNTDEMSVDDYSAKLKIIKDYCSASGTNYDRIEKTLETYILITNEPEQEQLLVNWANTRNQTNPERKRLGREATVVTLADIKREYIIGSIENVTERLGEYVALGVQRFMIYFMDYPTFGSILPFVKEVIPSLS